MKGLAQFFVKYRRPMIYVVVGLAHALLLLYFKVSLKTQEQEVEPLAQVMKLVDVEEFVPPPPPPEPDEEIIEVSDQPEASEQIVEVEQEVIESDEGIPTDQVIAPPAEPEYLAQHKISQIPEIPSQEILDRIIYPPIALRQGLEAVVYLELFIDQDGNIRRVEVLRDPGNGFAEAALAALEGIHCRPAEANGEAVAVRFRYPIRFSLN